LNGIEIFHQNNMERKAKLKPLLINEMLSHLKKKNLIIKLVVCRLRLLDVVVYWEHLASPFLKLIWS
jgi:hypothetical protein